MSCAQARHGIWIEKARVYPEGRAADSRVAGGEEAGDGLRAKFGIAGEVCFDDATWGVFDKETVINKNAGGGVEIGSMPCVHTSCLQEKQEKRSRGVDRIRPERFPCG